jgi:hypothetical protein
MVNLWKYVATIEHHMENYEISVSHFCPPPKRKETESILQYSGDDISIIYRYLLWLTYLRLLYISHSGILGCNVMQSSQVSEDFWKTSVNIYRNTRRYNTEQRTLDSVLIRIYYQLLCQLIPCISNCYSYSQCNRREPRFMINLLETGKL